MDIDNLKSEIALVEESLLNEPKNIDLLLRHSELLRRLGYIVGSRDYATQALKDNDIAVELAPLSPLPWLERGMTYYTLDKQDLAIADYNTSINIKPSDRAYYNRAVSLWRKLEALGKAKQGAVTIDVENVLDDYQKAIDLNPNHDNAFYNRGVVYLRMGRFQNAIDDFSVAIKIKPGDPSSFLNRAICYENLTNPRYSNLDNLLKAIDDYSTSINLQPDNLQALYNRALCFEFLSSKGRYGERDNIILAISDYTQILKFDSNNIAAFFNRGWAFESIGQVDKALYDFEQFTKLSKNNEEVKQIRAHIKEIRSRKI